MLKNVLEGVGKITFKPLRHGFYRCNQTGVKTKDSKGYAETLYRQRLNLLKQKHKATLKQITIEAGGGWTCPTCRKGNYEAKLNNIASCTRCHTGFNVTQQKKEPTYKPRETSGTWSSANYLQW